MQAERPLLHVIDGSNYIFRAFYAIRGVSTPKGEPTNAVYGFTQMLQKVLAEDKPELIAITFDPGTKTFRSEIYPDYKAHRPPPPEDLVPQIPRIRQVTETFRIPQYLVEGFEADDVIATLVRHAKARDMNVRIITGDKDMMQLVEDGRVKLWEPMKGAHVERKDVIEKLGVAPEQVVDLLALSGDSTDNIPGVKGVGEKTAAKLLQEHGDLEGIIAAAKAGKIKGKMGERIAQAVEDARISKRLVALRDDVPLDFDLEKLRYRGPDVEKQQALFVELDFKRLINKPPVPETQAALAAKEELAKARPIDPSRYRVIIKDADLDALLAEVRKAPSLSIAVELTSKRVVDAEVLGIGLAWGESDAAYVPIGHRYLGAPPQLSAARVLGALKPLLEDPKLPKVSAQSKLVAAIAEKAGIRLTGLVFDDTIASYLLDPDAGDNEIHAIAKRVLGHEVTPREPMLGKGRDKRTFDQLTADEAAKVVAEEADVVLRAQKTLRATLEKADLLPVMTDIELPLVPVLARMELAGVKVDTTFLGQLGTTFEAELEALSNRCYEAAGHEFDIGSTPQLRKVLFEELGLRVVKSTKTGASTDASVLEELADSHPLPQAILDYRQVQKLQSTYVVALPRMVVPETGRVHTVLSQTVAATGRLSSTDPNLQNIPIRTELGRQLRRAFIAEPGHVLISVDYSQIELRVLAHFSEEPVLMLAFRNDEDVHTRTASVLFEIPPEQVSREQRTQAKAVNFGVLYGMGPMRLARQLNLQRRVATKFIDDYFERQPKVKQFVDGTLANARKDEFVRTLFGRRRYVRDIVSKNRALRGQAERIAVNTPVQGTAADLIKLAMIRVHARLADERSKARLILQVHDELLLEAPEGEAEKIAALVKREMEGAYPLAVPLVADVHWGKSWDEAH